MKHDLLERFSNNDFLLERARATIRYLSQQGAEHLLSFVGRALLFSGLLGLMWTLSHLNPQGDLALYLIPITLLALPIGFISPQEGKRDRLNAYLFLGVFYAAYVWSIFWYFQHFGASPLAMGVEFGLIALLTGVTLRQRSLSWDAPQLARFRLFWLLGVVGCLVPLGVLTYYLVNQKGPEPGTSNLITTSTFLLLLTLTIVRVYWLDGIRARRANRGEYTPPPDYVRLLEWLIPRSYAFTVVLVLLLVAESMMFSTIYRVHALQEGDQPRSPLVSSPVQSSPVQSSPVQSEDDQGSAPQGGAPQPKAPLNEANQSSQPQDTQPPPPMTLPWGSELYPADRAPKRKPLQERPLRRDAPNPSQQRAVPPSASPQAPPQEQQTETARAEREPLSAPQELTQEKVFRQVGLGEWLFFSFKPYVFPKDERGREVSAPPWFKVLGRALLGLIIAILLTKQLNIWKQLSGLYVTLIGARRRALHLGDSEELKRQRAEMSAGLAAMFNTHATFWRWRLLKAVTAPTMSFSWRVLLDPSSAFYLAIDRVRQRFVEGWHFGLLLTAVLLTLIILPAPLIDDGLWGLIPLSLGPIWGAYGLFWLIRALGVKPPRKVDELSLWLALAAHLLCALLGFFLSVNMGGRVGFWPSALLNMQLITLAPFLFTYFFTKGRHQERKLIGLRDKVTVQDSDYELRIELLRSFTHTEHRLWLARHLALLLHPVRSSTILQLRLLWSSLLIALLETFKATLDALSSLIKRVSHDERLSITYWIWLQGGIGAGAMVVHLINAHVWFPKSTWWAHCVSLALLLLPAFSVKVLLPKSQGRRLLSTQQRERFAPLLRKVGLGVSLLSVVSLSLLSERWGALREVQVHTPFGLLFMIPLMPIWTTYKRVRLRELKRSTPQRLERLVGSLITRLRQIEQNALTNAYQLASKAHPLELTLRYELIDACAELIELTYQDLQCGAWYEEEEHAIKRVYRSWVGSDEAEGEKREIIEELTRLQEHQLDHLSSLLYDVTLTERFGERGLLFGDDEEQPKSPYIKALLSSLVRIARLPKPHALGEVRATPGLQELYVTLDHLAWTLLLSSDDELYYSLKRVMASDEGNTDERSIHAEEIEQELAADLSLREVLLSPRRQLTCELNEELTASVIELLCHLNPTLASARLRRCAHLLSAEERVRLTRDVAHDVSELKELLTDPSLAAYHQQIREALISTQLPTPLADRALDVSAHERAYHVARSELQAYELAEGVNLSHLTSTQSANNRHINVHRLSRAFEVVTLQRLQHPRSFEVLKRHLELKEGLERRFERLTQRLKVAYLSLFGYLFALMKDESVTLTDDQDHQVGLLQDLGWSSLEELRLSASTLRRLKLSAQLSSLEPLISASLSLINTSELKVMERAHMSPRDLERALVVWRELSERFVEEALPHCPPLTWRLETESAELALTLTGLRPELSPELKAGEGAPKREPQGLAWTLGRGVRLLGLGEPPDIDVYSALWVLKTLNNLAHSDNLFNSFQKDDRQGHRLLRDLVELTERFGYLLRSFAPEEQRQLEELYDLVSLRLALFENLTTEELKSLEGEGDINFESTFRKLKLYLDGLEGCLTRRASHLLKLKLLPTRAFVFLTGVEPCGSRELRWYNDLLSNKTKLTLMPAPRAREARLEREGEQAHEQQRDPTEELVGEAVDNPLNAS